MSVLVRGPAAIPGVHGRIQPHTALGCLGRYPAMAVRRRFGGGPAMAVALLAHALPAFCLHMHHHLPQGVRQHGGARGHQLAGINVKAAGVVPYVRTEDGSVLFLMQEMINGSRAGQLCDFGRRREPGDCDL